MFEEKTTTGVCVEEYFTEHTNTLTHKSRSEILKKDNIKFQSGSDLDPQTRRNGSELHRRVRTRRADPQVIARTE